MTIFLEDIFDSAHFLPNVPDGHKCRNIHGHTYRIRIEITGGIDPHLGWVIDYAEVKEAWLSVKSLIDHKSLNQIGGLSNSTCEVLSGWIASRLMLALPVRALPVRLSRIELRETEHCGVVWEP